MTDFIDHLSIKHYGCLTDVEIELSPLHALIGPNDSGKSTILRAIRTVAQFGAGPFTPRNNVLPFNPGLDRSAQYEISAHFHDATIIYSIVNENGDPADSTTFRDKPQYRFKRSLYQDDEDQLHTRPHRWQEVNALLKNGPRLLRLDPDALRAPSELIPAGEKSRLFDERGRGLPAIYDVLVNQNVEAFLAIKERVRELFPSIKSIGLNNVSSSTKVIQAQLTPGEWVSAEFMSEGLLYYLAFAALPYVDPPSILLVEEPENGLHPARIHEVMRVLREVSKTTQVLIATHNPLVVNELAPEEVSVVTRHPDTGTRVVRIDKTPDFEDRFKVYALGELWISYADGQFEEPLVEGREP